MVFATGYLAIFICVISLGFSLHRAEGLNFTLNLGSTLPEDIVCLSQCTIDTGIYENGEDRGTISLIDHKNPYQGRGVAYYHEPVEMLNIAAKAPYTKAASFSTSFGFYQRPERWSSNDSSQMRHGDGFTFVMSASNQWTGSPAARLGIFDDNNQPKLLVVEYDNFQNSVYDDINGDHIGVDTSSPNSTFAADVGNVGISLWDGIAIQHYSWIDYDAVGKVLEVRIAEEFSKPKDPLLSIDIDLLSVVEEKMWVGFSAGNGDAFSYYYFSNWTFSSYGLPPPPSGASGMIGVIIGVVIGGFLVLCILGGLLFFYIRRRNLHAYPKDNQQLLQMPGMPDSFSYRELSAATKSFNEQAKLGGGGFGNVYAGILPGSETRVAVKRMKTDSSQGEKEFLAEVSIISQLRHRNVVQILGYCKNKTNFLLVYELLPNGSLDRALFHPKGPEFLLSWSQRMKIVSGTAAALQYLHEGWRQQVIHRDVKSSNIMLDNEFNAKLGDFGLARLVDHEKVGATTLVAGTYGYLAPEASGTGKFTEKTDVFAFGAVALEIVCGRKAYDGALLVDAILVDVVWDCLKEGDLLKMVDSHLELDDEQEMYEMEVVLLLGLLCSHPDPSSRPSMRQVVQVLSGDAPVPTVPLQKPAAIYASNLPQISIGDLRNSKRSARSASNASDSMVSTTILSGPPLDAHGTSQSSTINAPFISTRSKKLRENFNQV